MLGGAVFRDERQTTIQAPDWAVFRAICRVGGGNGWYAANWLWNIRGWIYVLAGGPGLRCGRMLRGIHREALQIAAASKTAA
jgi:hypothetical protein